MAGGGGGMGAMSLIGGIIGWGAQSIGARERGRAIFAQAQETDLQADIEELNAKVNENDLRDRLMRTLAANAAATGASGVSGPSIAAGAMDDIDQAERAIGNERLSGLLKTGALRRQARQQRRDAKYTIILGKLGASANFLQGQSGSMQGLGGGGAPAAGGYNVGGRVNTSVGTGPA